MIDWSSVRFITGGHRRQSIDFGHWVAANHTANLHLNHLRYTVVVERVHNV